MASEKRERRGRPSKGRKVEVRLDPAMIERIEATDLGPDRASKIRALLTEALQLRENQRRQHSWAVGSKTMDGCKVS